MRHFVNLSLIGLVAIATYLIVIEVERPFLESIVQPFPGTTLNRWIDDFVIAAIIGVWVCAAFVVIWYLLAAFVFKVSGWRTGNRRMLWLTLGVLSLLCALVTAFWLTERAQSGGEIAWAFFVVNPLVLYYVSTSLFSPAAFKYIPLGARFVRRW